MFSNTESMSLPAETNELLLHIARQFVPLAPDATVVPVTGGFSGAGIWRIQDHFSLYALRRWPSVAPEPVRLRGLHRLLRHIWNQGLNEVAVPLSSVLKGSLISERGRWWQIEPWMPGVANFNADPHPERLKHAMHRLAHWHAAARTFVPTTDEQEWFDVRTAAPVGLCERVLKLRSWNTFSRQTISRSLPQPEGHCLLPSLLSEIFGSAQRLVQPIINLLEPLSVQQVPLQPCLRDIWHDHLLFCENRLTGLIDPGACRTDHFAADLSRLLGSLFGDDRDAWKVALEHYQALQPLRLLDWSLLRAYNQSQVLLSGITWLEWLVLERRTFPDASIVEQRLQVLLRRLSRLEQETFTR